MSTIRPDALVAAPALVRASGGASSRLWDNAALAVFALVALAVALTFRDYGLGWDDYTHSQMGDLLLALYGSGFKDQRAFSFVNLYMYGGGFDMAAALAAKLLPFDLFETRRLMGGLVGLVGLAITWRLARRVAGPRAGFFAAVLLAACPLYYGHMFINAKDTPFAVAVVLLVYALVRLYEAYPRPGAALFGLFALALGASIGTRIMGGVAVLYIVLPQLVVMKADLDRAGAAVALGNAARFALGVVLALPFAYAVMGALWPWSVLSPLNPLHAIVYFDHFFETPWRELFNGTLILVPDMPWTYLPTLFALKLPELFSVATLLGAGLVVRSTWQGEGTPQARAGLLVVLCAAFVPILLAIVTRPALYNGLRHFLFVVPPMAVLGGLGADWLL
ncbi:MAG: glycosyltransferase family 39 protein, partial [Rhizobiales bacterium]|nr:glycosyltransferase family 39 protein [Hyphomicrobiales bacterium]